MSTNSENLNKPNQSNDEDTDTDDILLRPVELIPECEPSTSEEAKSFVLQILQFQWKNAKLTKKDFIEFVRYYNAHKAEVNLDAAEVQALKQLREMWNQVNKATELPYFFEMKDHHTVLNGRLLCGIIGNKNKLWETYIRNFQRWRCSAMVYHYKLIKCMNGTDAEDGASSNGGTKKVPNKK